MSNPAALAYYNEIDPFAADWLENLIAAGHLPAGCVDRRSIEDVAPGDLDGYAQHHFFAGIGGWPFALRMAGWDDEQPIWTASCPCQPFSAAGKGAGVRDKRHLWPALRALIAECRPATVLGEQVASADGRLWLARVRADLEELGYACGAADLCAAGVAAPHLRQRLYWVAHTTGARRDDPREHGCGPSPLSTRPEQHGANGGMGQSGLARWPKARAGSEVEARREFVAQRQGAGTGAWAGSEIIRCRDGRDRRISVESWLQPLADGFPGSRIGVLRAAGNALCVPLAAEFIRAAREAIKGGQ